MNTSYVSNAIDYTRWSRGTPRGPVIANACSSGPPLDQAAHRAIGVAATPGTTWITLRKGDRL